MKVKTFSRVFPAYHPKAGQPKTNIQVMERINQAVHLTAISVVIALYSDLITALF